MLEFFQNKTYFVCSDIVNTKALSKQEKAMARTATIQTRVDPKTKKMPLLCQSGIEGLKAFLFGCWAKAGCHLDFFLQFILYIKQVPRVQPRGELTV